MKRKLLPLLTVSLLVCLTTWGQEISVQNTNPTTIQWNVIRTPGFNILFPKGFDEQAQRMANTLEHIREPESVTLQGAPRPITILLQNQSAISNGSVTLGPRRSEFLTMPPQNYNFIGTNDWLDLLASHEYRHVVQYQRSRVGFNKLVSYALGQNAWALVAHVAVPQWFWEGDAVATETAFTKSGRGKIPYFGMLFRTNLLEGRTFDYHKQFVRSYKHNIPDHYVLGYHLITHLRNKTGDPLIWDKAATRAWRYPFIPFTFNRSVKKESGMSLNTLYKSMADSLRGAWQHEIAALTLTKFKTINERTSKSYIDYLYPQPQEDGSVIAVRSGIGEITTIVRLVNGRVTKKFVVGPFNDAGMLSAVDGKVVWNETRYDPRWRMKTYSIVKGYDFGIRRQKTLSKHSRFSGAAISQDATKVATIESNNAYRVRLVILDYNSGAEIKSFDNPDNDMISMPRWSNDGSAVIALRLSKDNKKISSFDVNTGTIKDLLDAGNENVGHPVLSADGKFLFYNSAYSGIDNIYALETASGKKYQVTSSKYGAFNPAISPDGDWIYYNEQTRDGMDIAATAFEPTLWKTINEVQPPEANFYDKLITQEEHPDIMKDVPTKKFPVSMYNRLGSMINIHSWGPFFNTDITQADIGISSRNLLGTTMINAGYLFDIIERTGNYHAGLSYQGLYPILDFNVLYGQRSLNSIVIDKDVKLSWEETTVSGGVRLPLLLTRSKFITSVTLKNVVGVTQVDGFRYTAKKNDVVTATGTTRLVRVNDSLRYVFDGYPNDGILLTNQFGFSLANYLKQSRRDFNPRWGQFIDAELYSTPYGGDFQGNLAAFRASLYFPGVAKHHSLLLRGGYQVGTSGDDLNRYSFRNRIFRPRGFTYAKDSEFLSASVNYALPLWYPDLRLGPMLNVQRLRTNVFYDFGKAVGRNYFYADRGRLYYTLNDRYFHSVGAEFTVDVNVMRLLPQLDMGVRVSYINPQLSFLNPPNPSLPGFGPKFVVEFVLGTLNL